MTAAPDTGVGTADALVLFAATGDLAQKKIFPALDAMSKRRVLTVPVTGVASWNWERADLRDRARQYRGHSQRPAAREAIDRQADAQHQITLLTRLLNKAPA